MAVIAAAMFYWLRLSLPPPVLPAYTLLTSDRAGKRLYGTDGSRLYVLDDAVGAAQLPVNGGSPALIPFPGGVAAQPAIANVSPDGRYLAALLSDESGPEQFDFKARKWSTLVNGLLVHPSWPHDGRFIYFLHLFGNWRIERVAVVGGKIEQIADLRGLSLTGFLGFWLGLTPHDSPLLFKNTGT